jgi:transglutaminase-like putative cysteine protease
VTTRRTAVLAPIALAALTVVAALSLGRVFASSRFVAPVVVAALLPHLFGWVARRLRRPPWLVLLLSAALLVVFLFVRVATTPHAVSVVQALGNQLDAGWHLLRTAPAPAPATNGAILLACIAVWITATLADWLAFARRATLGAVAPALVFFVWTSALGTADDRVLGTAAFCLAAGLFLVVQNIAVLDTRRSWLVSDGSAPAHWLLPATALGSVAIVAALILAPALPGAGGEPVVDFANPARSGSGGRSYRPSLAPFVDIGDKLSQPDNAELFTVKSRLPDYWRIAALDTYSNSDGGQWTLSASGEGGVSVGLPSDAPPGTLVQDFSIGALTERWLPAAYRPVAINLDGTLVVTSSSTLVTDHDSVSGLDYTVASSVPLLRASAEQQAATAAPVPASLKPYTALPADVPSTIGDQARQVVKAADATTPYAQAAALRDWFRNPANGFVYDTSVSATDSGNAIVQFLQDKHGFCVQFASAYAVMARSLGIPARVAVGFTPGELGSDGRYHVTTHDAHAWPEVWLAGIGWTHMFEPTPAAGGGAVAGGSNLPGDNAVGGTTTPATTTTVPQTTRPGQTAPTSPATGGTGGTSSGGGGSARPTLSADSGGGSSPWLAIIAVVLVLLALVGAYAGGVLFAKSRRRARRRHRDDPTAAIAGAWEEALDRLREARVEPDPALTPLELAHEVPSHTHDAVEAPMHDLAAAYTTTRYGSDAPAADTVERAWANVALLERALDTDQGLRERWRRRLDVAVLTRR